MTESLGDQFRKEVKKDKAYYNMRKQEKHIAKIATGLAYTFDILPAAVIQTIKTARGDDLDVLAEIKYIHAGTLYDKLFFHKWDKKIIIWDLIDAPTQTSVWPLYAKAVKQQKEAMVVFRMRGKKDPWILTNMFDEHVPEVGVALTGRIEIKVRGFSEAVRAMPVARYIEERK